MKVSLGHVRTEWRPKKAALRQKMANLLPARANWRPDMKWLIMADLKLESENLRPKRVVSRSEGLSET